MLGRELLAERKGGPGVDGPMFIQGRRRLLKQGTIAAGASMVGDQDVDMTKCGPRLADQTGWRIGFSEIATERLNSPPGLQPIANG